MAYERRSFSAIAVETVLDGTINNSVEAFSVASAAGWSDSQGDFFVQIEDEMIRCETISGNDISVKSGGRGAEGTSAVSHTSGVACLYVIGKTDLDEANYTVAETVGKVTTSQDLLVADGANSLTRLGITNNRALIVSSSLISWGQVTSAMIATDAVGSTQIAADAVGASEIAANAVGSSEIAADAVTTSELANDAVETLNILDANVTLAKLASASVNQSKLVSGLRLHNVATSAPTGADGDLWYDTDDELLFAYNGTDWVCITPKTTVVATAETRNAATYAALSTPGPVVSIVTGTKALVTIGAKMANDTLGNYCLMSYAVSGATTVAASDTTAVSDVSAYATDESRQSRTSYLTGLTAGTNVFTAVYKAVNGIATFTERTLTVVGIP